MRPDGGSNQHASTRVRSEAARTRLLASGYALRSVFQHQHRFIIFLALPPRPHPEIQIPGESSPPRRYTRITPKAHVHVPPYVTRPSSERFSRHLDPVTTPQRITTYRTSLILLPVATASRLEARRLGIGSEHSARPWGRGHARARARVRGGGGVGGGASRDTHNVPVSSSVYVSRPATGSRIGRWWWL